MAKLQSVEHESVWREFALGKAVYEKYMSLAKNVMHFEKIWFANWKESVDIVAMQHLKAPIFSKHAETGRSTASQQRVAVRTSTHLYCFSVHVHSLPAHPSRLMDACRCC